MSEASQKPKKTQAPANAPGDGIRSMRSTNVFRAINFELYAKPVRLFYQILLIFHYYDVIYSGSRML